MFIIFFYSFIEDTHKSSEYQKPGVQDSNGEKKHISIPHHPNSQNVPPKVPKIAIYLIGLHDFTTFNAFSDPDPSV